MMHTPNRLLTTPSSVRRAPNGLFATAVAAMLWLMLGTTGCEPFKVCDDSDAEGCGGGGGMGGGQAGGMGGGQAGGMGGGAPSTGPSGGMGGGGSEPVMKHTFTAVAAGYEHSCAIDSAKNLLCWGRGDQGQLADGLPSTKKHRRAKPTKAEKSVSNGGQPPSDTFKQVTAGRYHSCAIDEEGYLYCWGEDEYGAVGVTPTAGTNRTNTVIGKPTRVTVDETAHNDWTAVSASSRIDEASLNRGHTCAIRAGQLYCWGDNTFGQLGLGDSAQRRSPTRVGTASDWQTVSAGSSHTCAIRAGQLYCFGSNDTGQLGALMPDPNAVGGTRVGSASNWQSVAAGANHSCAIDQANKLYCWGAGDKGQLGVGNNNPVQTPQPIAGDWLSVAIGASLQRYKIGTTQNFETFSFTCGIKTNGTLWCWGSGVYGQLGIGAAVERSNNPVAVGSRDDHIALSAGGRHACALRSMSTPNDPSDDTVWCWGSFGQGQTGNGHFGEQHEFVTATSPATFASVSAGAEASCGVKTDGTLWCWGRDSFELLGQTTLKSIDRPTQVGSDTDWSLVDVGHEKACAIKTDTSLHCWGQLENGMAVSTPTGLQPASGWQNVSCGGARTQRRSCCGVVSGQLYCWGSNDSGQLGFGDTTARTSPTRVGTETNWASVSMSNAANNNPHACATKTDGQLWCWGGNGQGQLGLGNETDETTPVAVGVDLDWQSVQAGSSATCAIKTNGALYCWGNASKNWGASANANVDSNTPMLVQAPPNMDNSDAVNDWVSVSLHYRHGCGIRGMVGKRSLWCWGANDHGALGLGFDSPVQQKGPARVKGTTDWEMVSVGGRPEFTNSSTHSLALSSAGQLHASGDNLYGQLGTGSFSLSPTRIIDPY